MCSGVGPAPTLACLGRESGVSGCWPSSHFCFSAKVMVVCLGVGLAPTLPCALRRAGHRGDASRCWPGSPPCLCQPGYWWCVQVLAWLPPCLVFLWRQHEKSTGWMCPGVGLALPLASSMSTKGTWQCVWVLVQLLSALVCSGCGGTRRA